MKVEFSPDQSLVGVRPARAPARPAPPADPAPAAAQPQAAQDPSAVDAQVDAAVSAANQSMRSVATNLKFEKDSDNGKIVVRVIDSETQQVLRQMPSEEMLAMSKALDRLQGLMVRHKV